MDQWRASGSLLGRGLSGAVRIVADTHRVITDRIERHSPEPVAAGVRLHGLSAQATYRAVSMASEHTPVLAAGILAARRSEPSQTGAVRWANGLFGDLLREEYPALSFPMAIRLDGRDATAEDFAAWPDATGNIVVFVHGLTETEQCWKRGRFPQRSQEELGSTAVQVRYNSGLPVADNGRDLSMLLDELLRAWPVPVRSVSLVGHSMGGLVARSACLQASTDLASRLDAVITLGTPHLGSPWEKLAHVADLTMRQIPDTEPLGRILGARSAGVRDLRHGCDEQVPAVRYYWIAGSLTGNSRHPLAQSVGDGLVRAASASGSGRQRSLPMTDGVLIPGVSHMGLLADDSAYEAMARWLA